jgi:hypothetical protein
MMPVPALQARRTLLLPLLLLPLLLLGVEAKPALGRGAAMATSH